MNSKKPERWRARLDDAVIEARKWARRALAARHAPQVQTLVLYVNDVDVSAAWYRDALGVTWTREKHATGPEHVSAQVGGLLIELYPRGDRPASRVRIELSVGDRFGNADHAPEPIPRRLTDPDGNTVVVTLRD
ncbi:VOC family protein [Tsukamurella tyrosinosolvens]|uniref:VOC family protein n=1 Tax=Tsukamurella tyrosinosolvens TaxID=57704 RepID=UPI002DD44A07|nr:VOC family protein [Tsukamurella tyrosinosolvens]MEC4615719.1 VOC family protein [Tsukamurella tyrosinosolvens]